MNEHFQTPKNTNMFQQRLNADDFFESLYTKMNEYV